MTANPVPGELFASDYRIKHVLGDQLGDRCYLAVEKRSGRRLRIVELSAAQSLKWATSAVEHASLPESVAVLTVLDSNFGVFEEVEGTRLSARLSKVGPLGAIDAVRTALRVTEALTVLHRTGLVHGAVGPDNVVFTAGRTVLMPGAASERTPGYSAPERADADPEPQDDLWAAGALLFEMLTAMEPPAAGISAPEQLEEAGIEEDVLGGILAQALAADPNRRSMRIASMRHPLSSWLDRHEQQPESAPGTQPRVFAWSRAVLPGPSDRPPPRRDSEAPALEVGEGHLSEPPPRDSAPASRRDSRQPQIEVGEGHLSEPPPEDGMAREAPTATPAPAPESRRSRWPLIAAAALVVCGGALLLARSGKSPAAPVRSPAARAHRPPTRHVKKPAPTRTAPPPRPTPTPVASVAPEASASAAPADESVAACVGRHLPALSFTKTPDLDWLCHTGDPRPGAQRLHGDVVRAADGKSISPAMQLWSPLSWYGMAEFAVLRGACCPGAALLKLPAPAPGCESMAEKLNSLAAQTAAGGDPTPQVQAFADAISCEMRHHRQVVFWQKDRPAGNEPHSFEKLLESAMHPRSTP